MACPLVTFVSPQVFTRHREHVGISRDDAGTIRASLRCVAQSKKIISGIEDVGGLGADSASEHKQENNPHPHISSCLRPIKISQNRSLHLSCVAIHVHDYLDGKKIGGHMTRTIVASASGPIQGSVHAGSTRNPFRNDHAWS